MLSNENSMPAQQQHGQRESSSKSGLLGALPLVGHAVDGMQGVDPKDIEIGNCIINGCVCKAEDTEIILKYFRELILS